MNLEKRKELFVKRLLLWYKSNKRDFDWRKRFLTPYEVLILEIMLQRTPADRVNKLFDRFLKKYPNPYVLLTSSNEELERNIQTLGLQKRRKMLLKNLANYLVKKYNGQPPITEEELLQLPGVGKYVANAVLCYSHGKTVPLIDTNAARVLGRVFGFRVSRNPSTDRNLWVFTENILPTKSVREFNWALIDLGAAICKPKSPLCDNCPISGLCLYALSR